MRQIFPLQHVHICPDVSEFENMQNSTSQGDPESPEYLDTLYSPRLTPSPQSVRDARAISGEPLSCGAG